MTGIKITGTGSYAPEMVVENNDFAAFLDTSDEWIRTRTGMHRRHISSGEPTWFMGAAAAKKAMEAAGIASEQIGLIVASTVTPDYYCPSLACLIQREVGAIGCGAFDISAACAGFVYAMDIAARWLATDDTGKSVLVVSAENLTKLVDYTDRSTCVLFGDGAAAVVLEKSESLYGSYITADGNGAKFVGARALKPRNAFMKTPFAYQEDMPEGKDDYLFQDGREVYKFATRVLPAAVKEAARKAGIAVSDIDLIIPHQANFRIIETAAAKFGLPIEKFYMNLEEYGNTSSASIPIALDEAVRSGKIQHGDTLCVVGFGSGLVCGAAVFNY